MNIPSLPSFWVAQGIGVLAVIVTIVAFLSTTRRRLLSKQIAAALLFCAHFILLAAPIGAAMNLVVILRNIVYEFKGSRRWAATILWPFIFAALSMLILVYAWEGWRSIFPVAGVLIATFGLWHNRPATMRLFLVVSTLAWVPYMVIVRSYPGLINQLIVVAFLIFGIVHIDHPSAERKRGDESTP